MIDKMNKIKNSQIYVYDKKLQSGDSVIVLIPQTSNSVKEICEIGWQSDGSVSIYGTIATDPSSVDAIWDEIVSGEEINRSVSALKLINNGSLCNVAIRIIMK